MSTPAEIQLAKAVTTTDKLVDAGGLNPVQASTLIDYVIQQADLTNLCRVERFRNKQYDIDKINLGRRVAMAKDEAIDPQRRRSVQHSKISMVPKDIVVPFEISHQYLRQNIEGMSVEDHIIRMMGDALMNDVQELALSGNTLGPAAAMTELFEDSNQAGYIVDKFLSLQDGWSKLAEGAHIFDAEDANISPDVFSNALQAMPEKFQRDFANMRFIMPMNLAHKYDARIALREDTVGGAALQGGRAPHFGIQRQPVSLWGTTPLIVEHVTLNGTTPAQLSNAPISEVLSVTKSTLGSQVPETPYVLTTDYTVDEALGQVTRVALGAIGDGDVVKVTYKAQPQMLLTNLRNLILGFDTEDIRILRGQEIYRDVYQYVMHMRIAVQIQELDAVVKVKNIGLG